VSPWRSRLPSLQLKIAVLAGRAQHAQRYEQDIAAIQNDAATLRTELEAMHAELSPVAGSDPSGQVRDVLLAADALIARLHVISHEGTNRYGL
jgi:xanthine dehydrogenase iron-sulfur cluster and FAD-binding subunit A